MERMEGYLASVSLGEESSQMWTLNKRLEAYLARVKALEEENELLRNEIHHLKSTKSERCWKRKFHEEMHALRDALDEGHRQLVEVEMSKDILNEEIELVTQLCLQERQAQEDAKKALSESKKLLEEEKRAQIWLKEKLAQLEEELEDIIAMHEEETVEMEKEISSFSQRLENFRVAPIAFKPVDVDDYANKLSEIWQSAVESYKSEVSVLETSLSEANENLKKVQEENKQSRLQMQNLDKELQSLKMRKEMLEELLSRQWHNQQEEEEQLLIEVETLEKEKQDLRTQIAQVLEDRQQLMHLKMSLSLEVATYRSLLEAENTRIYPSDYKLSNSFSDSLLEQSSARKRQPESSRKQVSREYRLSSSRKHDGEKNELLRSTPKKFLNVKSSTFQNKTSPVTKEFQKVSSVLQSQDLKYTKAPSVKAISTVESSREKFPQNGEFVKQTKVENISNSYYRSSSKTSSEQTVRHEKSTLPILNQYSSNTKAMELNGQDTKDTFEIDSTSSKTQEVLITNTGVDHLESTLKKVEEMHKDLPSDFVLEGERFVEVHKDSNVEIHETVQEVPDVLQVELSEDKIASNSLQDVAESWENADVTQKSEDSVKYIIEDQVAITQSLAFEKPITEDTLQDKVVESEIDVVSCQQVLFEKQIVGCKDVERIDEKNVEEEESLKIPETTADNREVASLSSPEAVEVKELTTNDSEADVQISPETVETPMEDIIQNNVVEKEVEGDSCQRVLFEQQEVVECKDVEVMEILNIPEKTTDTREVVSLSSPEAVDVKEVISIPELTTNDSEADVQIFSETAETSTEDIIQNNVVEKEVEGVNCQRVLFEKQEVVECKDVEVMEVLNIPEITADNREVVLLSSPEAIETDVLHEIRCFQATTFKKIDSPMFSIDSGEISEMINKSIGDYLHKEVSVVSETRVEFTSQNESDFEGLLSFHSQLDVDQLSDGKQEINQQTEVEEDRLQTPEDEKMSFELTEAVEGYGLQVKDNEYENQAGCQSVDIKQDTNQYSYYEEEMLEPYQEEQRLFELSDIEFDSNKFTNKDHTSNLSKDEVKPSIDDIEELITVEQVNQQKSIYEVSAQRLGDIEPDTHQLDYDKQDIKETEEDYGHHSDANENIQQYESDEDYSSHSDENIKISQVESVTFSQLEKPNLSNDNEESKISEPSDNLEFDVPIEKEVMFSQDMFHKQDNTKEKDHIESRNTEDDHVDNIFAGEETKLPESSEIIDSEIVTSEQEAEMTEDAFLKQDEESQEIDNQNTIGKTVDEQYACEENQLLASSDTLKSDVPNDKEVETSKEIFCKQDEALLGGVEEGYQTESLNTTDETADEEFFDKENQLSDEIDSDISNKEEIKSFEAMLLKEDEDISAGIEENECTKIQNTFDENNDQRIVDKKNKFSEPLDNIEPDVVLNEQKVMFSGDIFQKQAEDISSAVEESYETENQNAMDENVGDKVVNEECNLSDLSDEIESDVPNEQEVEVLQHSEESSNENAADANVDEQFVDEENKLSKPSDKTESEVQIKQKVDISEDISPKQDNDFSSGTEESHPAENQNTVNENADEQFVDKENKLSEPLDQTESDVQMKQEVDISEEISPKQYDDFSIGTEESHTAENQNAVNENVDGQFVDEENKLFESSSKIESDVSIEDECILSDTEESHQTENQNTGSENLEDQFSEESKMSEASEKIESDIDTELSVGMLHKQDEDISSGNEGSYETETKNTTDENRDKQFVDEINKLDSDVPNEKEDDIAEDMFPTKDEDFLSGIEESYQTENQDTADEHVAEHFVDKEKKQLEASEETEHDALATEQEIEFSEDIFKKQDEDTLSGIDKSHEIKNKNTVDENFEEMFFAQENQFSEPSDKQDGETVEQRFVDNENDTIDVQDNMTKEGNLVATYEYSLESEQSGEKTEENVGEGDTLRNEYINLQQNEDEEGKTTEDKIICTKEDAETADLENKDINNDISQSSALSENVSELQTEEKLTGSSMESEQVIDMLNPEIIAESDRQSCLEEEYVKTEFNLELAAEASTQEQVENEWKEENISEFKENHSRKVIGYIELSAEDLTETIVHDDARDNSVQGTFIAQQNEFEDFSVVKTNENSDSEVSVDSQEISVCSQKSEDLEISKDYQLEQTLPDSTPLPNFDDEFEDLTEEHIALQSEPINKEIEQFQNADGSGEKPLTTFAVAQIDENETVDCTPKTEEIKEDQVKSETSQDIASEIEAEEHVLEPSEAAVGDTKKENDNNSFNYQRKGDGLESIDDAESEANNVLSVENECTQSDQDVELKQTRVVELTDSGDSSFSSEDSSNSSQIYNVSELEDNLKDKSYMDDKGTLSSEQIALKNVEGNETQKVEITKSLHVPSLEEQSDSSENTSSESDREEDKSIDSQDDSGEQEVIDHFNEYISESATHNGVNTEKVNGFHEHSGEHNQFDLSKDTLNSQSNSEHSESLHSDQKVYEKHEGDIVESHGQEFVDDSLLQFEVKSEGLFQSLLGKSESKEGDKTDEIHLLASDIKDTIESPEHAESIEESRIDKLVQNPYLSETDYDA
ncbi:nestin [Discoglossus pictus]